MQKILILGNTGKMGNAIMHSFKSYYNISGKNHQDFDAINLTSVKEIVESEKPDYVINTVAFMGIDPCEMNPEKAIKINAIYPKFLAELSNEENFTLIHFSTDSVFSGQKKGFYVESDIPDPINIYGLTKYGGDCFVQSIANKYYILRLSVLFGKSESDQFVEKMLVKLKKGENLKIADDVISSPTYNLDVADRLLDIISNKYPYGLYHTINFGQASLYELMCEIVKNLGVSSLVTKGSYKDFPYTGNKNLFTPLISEKLPPLRDWKDAVKEYCNSVNN